MMTHQGHTDSVSQFTVNEVVGKAFEIRAMQARFERVKSSRSVGGHGNHPAQLGLELLAQTQGNRVVTLQSLCHVLLDGGMVFDPHCSRDASTRRQNSASGSG